jgi:ERI1 exoribonuclease 3
MALVQETVEKADPFPVVWERYTQWMKARGFFTDPTSYAFLTCGDWDLNVMLPAQLRLSFPDHVDPTDGINLGGEESLDVEKHFKPWINIKKTFATMYLDEPRHARRKPRPRGMASMLNKLGLSLEGRHHSGIDDCMNISRIVTRMREEGWQPHKV